MLGQFYGDNPHTGFCMAGRKAFTAAKSGHKVIPGAMIGGLDFASPKRSARIFRRPQYKDVVARSVDPGTAGDLTGILRVRGRRKYETDAYCDALPFAAHVLRSGRSALMAYISGADGTQNLVDTAADIRWASLSRAVAFQLLRPGCSRKAVKHALRTEVYSPAHDRLIPYR